MFQFPFSHRRTKSNMYFYIMSTLMFNFVVAQSDNFDINKVVYAINAGGNSHVDSLGIMYQADPLQGVVGVSSDYGRSLYILRVPEQDYELYQVERYHTSNFGYSIPIDEDGAYTLVLKFCEVYFNSKNMKVFDVKLNGVMIIEDLDIYKEVGRGVAFDVLLPFTVQNNILSFNDVETFLDDDHIYVEFAKGKRDNPKVNAIMVYKGEAIEYDEVIYYKSAYGDNEIGIRVEKVNIDEYKKHQVISNDSKPINTNVRNKRRSNSFWPATMALLTSFFLMHFICYI